MVAVGLFITHRKQSRMSILSLPLRRMYLRPPFCLLPTCNVIHHLLAGYLAYAKEKRSIRTSPVTQDIGNTREDTMHHSGTSPLPQPLLANDDCDDKKTSIVEKNTTYQPSLSCPNQIHLCGNQTDKAEAHESITCSHDSISTGTVYHRKLL